MDQPGDAPLLLVLAELPGVGAHGGLHAKEVPHDDVGLDVLLKELNGADSVHVTPPGLG
jgi:hypothetical protein